MADDSNPGFNEVVHRAFCIAGSDGERCQPVHLLAALTGGDGPIADALRSPSGDSLFPPRLASSPARGGTGSCLSMQTQQAARQLAEDRDQRAGPEHLFLAVLDQGDPQAVAVLTHVGLDPAALRAAAFRSTSARHSTPEGTAAG